MSVLNAGSELLSPEIQAVCYREVLRIIQEKGCSYEEGWKIFQKQMERQLFGENYEKDGMKTGPKIFKEGERRQKNTNR